MKRTSRIKSGRKIKNNRPGYKSERKKKRGKK